MNNQLFAVLLALALALLLQTWGQTRIQLRNQDSLQAQRTQQQALVDEARGIRQQLEAIAGETARLADGGNPHAQRIRAALQEQGINISAARQAE